MNQHTAIIELSKYKETDTRCFVGKEYGRIVALKMYMAELLYNKYVVRIIIPSDTFSINPSFLESFISHSIQYTSLSSFKARVEFICNGDYKIYRDLSETYQRLEKL